MQSLFYSRCVPAPSATSSPPPLPSPAESDDDDVFVDIDGNDSDCDAVLSSSTRLCWDAVDVVDHKRFGPTSEYFGNSSSRHNVMDNEVGYSDRPTGNSAIFSLALFASSVLQPSTVPTVSQSFTSSGCSSASSASASSTRQLHHHAASGHSHRVRRQRRSPSFCPHSPSSSSSSSVSSSGSESPVVHGEIFAENSSLKPLRALHSSSVVKSAPSGTELRRGAEQRASEWKWQEDKQNRHLQPDSAQLPGCGAGARPPTRSNRRSFLIEEILRPDFGVRRRFDCDEGETAAVDSRRVAPDTTEDDSKSAQQLRQVGRPSSACNRGTPSPSGQTTLNVAERRSPQDHIETPYHERLGPKSGVSYDDGVTRKRKLSLTVSADDARGRNGASLASPSSRDSDTSSSQSKRTCNRSAEAARIGVGLTSSICSNSGVNPAFAKSSQQSTSSTQSSTSSSTSSSSTTSTVGSATSTMPLAAGKLPLPAWVYCTRYSDRPSSGPRSRRSSKRKTTAHVSTTEPNQVSAPSSGSSKAAGVADGSSTSSAAVDDKRPRTAFNADQLNVLRREFDEDRYLTEDRRRRLADQLGLHESQIKIWFQNKRAKLKKASGLPNPLAIELAAQGLYNHSTVTKDISSGSSSS